MARYDKWTGYTKTAGVWHGAVLDFVRSSLTDDELLWQILHEI